MTGRQADDPLVSVVVPTFKRPRRLRRALGTVRAQTYANWEMLVVDDNDEGHAERRETEQVMQEYSRDARIRYVKHASNKGGGAARNTGVKAASGHLVAFLDDDDEWLPQKLAAQVQVFQSNSPEVGLVYCGIRRIDHRQASTTSYDTSPIRRGTVFPDILERNFVGSTSCIMCRKTALFEAGLFDVSLPGAQDFELYIRMSQICQFEFVSRPLVVQNYHSDGRITDKAREIARVFETIYDRYSVTLAEHPQMHGRILRQQGRHLLLRAGENRKAAAKYREAFQVSRHPVDLVYWGAAYGGANAFHAVRLATKPFRQLVAFLIKRDPQAGSRA